MPDEAGEKFVTSKPVFSKKAGKLVTLICQGYVKGRCSNAFKSLYFDDISQDLSGYFVGVGIIYSRHDDWLRRYWWWHAFKSILPWALDPYLGFYEVIVLKQSFSNEDGCFVVKADIDKLGAKSPLFDLIVTKM